LTIIVSLKGRFSLVTLVTLLLMWLWNILVILAIRS